MDLRTDYPCDEAVNDLRVFFLNHISDEKVRAEFNELLDEALESKSLPMRHINHKFFEYRKENNSYTRFSADERSMMEDLMHFWA